MMRFDRFTLFIMVALATSQTVVRADIFTFPEISDAAIKNSRLLRSVKLEMKNAEAHIQELYGSVLPVVRASADAGHAFEQYIPYIIVDNEESGLWTGLGADRATSAALSPDMGESDQLTGVASAPFTRNSNGNTLYLPRNSVSAGLSFTQPLFLQGKAIINLRIARARQSQLVCRYEEVRGGVKCETARLFYASLLEQQRVKNQEERLRLAQEAHRLVRIDFASGRARELDTLNSLLNLQKSRVELGRAHSRRRLAAEALIAHCGLVESAATFWVEGSFPEPVFFITVDEAIEQLHQGNRRIGQFRAEEKIINGAINLERVEFLPILVGGGSIERTGMFSGLDSPSDIRWGNDQKLFLGLSWTIFSGFTRQNAIRRRVMERDRLFLEQQRIIDSLELRTRTLFEMVTVAQEEFESIRTIVDIAEKSCAQARRSSEIGSTTPFDVQSAETELAAARLSWNEALCRFHVALADFKYIIGLL